MSEEHDSEQSAADVEWLQSVARRVDGASFIMRRPGVPDAFVTDPYTGEQWMTLKDGDTITYEFDVPGVVAIKTTSLQHMTALVECAFTQFLEVRHDR